MSEIDDVAEVIVQGFPSEVEPSLDELMLCTETHFSLLDRLRILFGRPVRVSTYGAAELVDVPEVLEALRFVRSEACVSRLFYLRNRGGFVVVPDA